MGKPSRARVLWLNLKVKAWCLARGRSFSEIGRRYNYFTGLVERARQLRQLQTVLVDIRQVELPKSLRKRLYWQSVERMHALSKNKAEFEKMLNANFGGKTAAHYLSQLKD